MIVEDYSQFVIVKADSAEEFQEKLNSAVYEVRAKKPKVTFNLNETFCAYVEYNATVKQCETVRDMYHLQGVYYHCRNCPYHEDAPDRRYKKVNCKFSDWGYTHLDSEACEFFYKQVMNNQVIPDGV